MNNSVSLLSTFFDSNIQKNIVDDYLKSLNTKIYDITSIDDTYKKIFIDFKDKFLEKIWFDSHSSLMWTKENVELNSVDLLNWEDAMKACRQARVGGYSDWRLPTTVEVKALKYAHNRLKGLELVELIRYFNDSFYWTASEPEFVNKNELETKIAVWFKSYSTTAHSKSEKCYVRAVRG